MNIRSVAESGKTTWEGAAGFSGERLTLPLATVPEVAIPAVHLEIAYLSNPAEAAVWRTQTVLRAAAGAIWAGLARYRP